MAYNQEYPQYKNNGSNVYASTGSGSSYQQTVSAFKAGGTDVTGDKYYDAYANYMKRAFDSDKFKVNGAAIDICKRGYRPRNATSNIIHLGPGSYTMTCASDGSKSCNGISLSAANTAQYFQDALFIWGVGAGGSGGTGNSTRNGAGGAGGCAFAGILTFNGSTNNKVVFSVGTGGAVETGDGDNDGHDGGHTYIQTYNSAGTLIAQTYFRGGTGGGSNGGAGGSGGSRLDVTGGVQANITDVRTDAAYMAYITTATGGHGGNAGAYGSNVSWTYMSQRPEGGIAKSYSGGKPGGSNNNRGGGGGASGFHNGGYGTTYKNDSEAGTYGSGSGGTGYRVAGSIGDSGKGGDGFIEMNY